MARPSRRPLLLAALGLGLAADAVALTSTTEVVHAIAADGEVAIENINGSITISTWDRPEVAFTAVKTADTQEALDSIQVDVHKDARSFRVETTFGRSPAFKSWPDREVDYTLQVPAGIHLDGIESVNGSIEVSGTTGRVSLETVNGSIRLRDATGAAELGTVNGSIRAAWTAVPSQGRITAESVNGAITLELPPGTAARLSARTVNGSIRNEFGLDVKKGFPIGSSLEGAIGTPPEDGAPLTLTTETVNGSISLRHTR